MEWDISKLLKKTLQSLTTNDHTIGYVDQNKIYLHNLKN